MKRIEAALPALGNYTVSFYEESEEVIDFLGEKELHRLDRVEHLGIASKVFTGVNHSRLEYALLQCAVISLLPKFEKGNENFALSAKVRIPGQESKISSAEELLKCWALLSNSGHAQYTYGVERSLLNQAKADPNFKILLVKNFPPKLKRWSLKAINEYQDSDFHYILSLIRISYLPARSRLKAKLYRILSSLLLPLEEITFIDSADKYKLFRLRRLFNQVRLLCIVTLDAYYSHHPVRYQLSSALMNISALMDETEEKSTFSSLMERTAAWLADEIYFHPRATAAQKSYELKSNTRFNEGYKPRIANENAFRDFYLNFMAHGFGAPKLDKLFHFARMSFQQGRGGVRFGTDTYQFSRQLEATLCKESSTYVSVVFNSYSNNIHIDLLYDRHNAEPSCISDLLTNTLRWLARLVEAQAVWRIRSLSPPTDAPEELINRIRLRFQEETIDKSYLALRNIFNGVIKYLLPDNLIGSMSEVMPQSDYRSLGAIITYVKGGKFDSLNKCIDMLIKDNPKAYSEDRLQELKALKYYINNSKAPYILACTEKFIIRDIEGRHVDDWDGLILEIFDDRVQFSVIEAKNLKSARKSENQSFVQLAATRKILSQKQKLKSRRKRIPMLGAVITYKFK